MPRSTSAKLIVALLSLCCAFGCSRRQSTAVNESSTGRPLVKVALQTDWLPVAEHGGYYQAVAKGFYREAGLDCSIMPGGPGAFGTQLVVTGEVAFAMGRGNDIMLAVQQGLPLVIVCAQMQHDPQALLFHEGDPAHTFSDLNGRVLAASSGTAWVEFLQKKYGIHFSVTPLDYGVARFAADPKLIQQCFVSSEPFFLKQKGVATRTLLLAESGYDPYRVIYTRTAFVREHPEIVRAFVAASIRGWNDFLEGDASPARALIAQANSQSPPELMDFSIEAIKRYRLVTGDPAKKERTGVLSRERFQTQQTLLLDLGMLKQPIEIDRFVRFDFVPPEPATAAP